MVQTTFEQLDLHGERAARRGNPSFVWRAGQSRRLDMILHWGVPARADGSRRVRRTLVDGCGVGMYVRALAAYSDEIYGLDIEPDHLHMAVSNVDAPHAHFQLAAGEELPYADNAFDFILSHEVLEHVRDDRLAVTEMARVLRPGGRAVIFVPNRLHPFETHGHYWRGQYHFGNTPLINYLPDTVRNRLAPHVRAYTSRGLLLLCMGLPVRVVFHTQVFPGYDNIVARNPVVGKWLRRITYALEGSPLAWLGNSHLLVVEKVLYP